MAVFTEVSLEAARPLFEELQLGTLLELKGIQGGIENTNYFATTDRGILHFSTDGATWLLERIE